MQRDPLRVNDPLTFQEDRSAINALEKLKIILQCEDLSWEELPYLVEKKLLETTKGKITWRQLMRNNDDMFDWNDYRR